MLKKLRREILYEKLKCLKEDLSKIKLKKGKRTSVTFPCHTLQISSVNVGHFKTKKAIGCSI